MANATLVKPDLAFVNEILNGGGDSLKKCYQCATCSVACKVTPDSSPFPRKEMVLAQWGQKDQLLGSADVWLCHQCGDCTELCPRGAKPGEVLGAIRKQAIKHLALVPFLSRVANEPALLPVLFAIPMAIFAAVLGALGHLNPAGIPRGAEGAIIFNKFMPIPFIDGIFTLTAVFAVVSGFVGIRRLWSSMQTASGPVNAGGLVGAIIPTIMDIMAHKKFSSCNTNRLRRFGHPLLFFAFVGLFLTTAWDVIYMYGHEIFGLHPIGMFHFGMPPVPDDDPLKVLAGISTLMFVLGTLLLIVNRVTSSAKASIGSYFDWAFIGVVIGVGLTGILSYRLRKMGLDAAYLVYYFHLVFIWVLFAYAPYSKFAHMFYRTTAMVFARHSGRK